MQFTKAFSLWRENVNTTRKTYLCSVRVRISPADPNRMNQPARIPLVTPGMPWIWDTLLAVKYLSQVALRKGESQNMRHSWVVTVPFAVSMVLAHTSKDFHTKVRLPKIHTLERREAQNVCQSIVVVAGARCKEFVLTSLVKVQYIKSQNFTLM